MRKTTRWAALGAGLACAMAPMAQGADIVLSTSNDSVGDGHDRWRSGAAQASVVFDTDEASYVFGRLGGGLSGNAAWEFRARGEVITPDPDRSAAAQDRLFVDTVGFALLVHEQIGPWRGYWGGEFDTTGEANGVRDTQEFIHDILELGDSYELGNDRRIDNHIFPTALVEGAYVGSAWGFDAVPFVDASIGIETFGRAGLDVSYGSDGMPHGWVRNTVTGMPIPLGHSGDGWSVVVTGGGDAGYVADSEYFQDATLAPPRDVRYRARLGAIVSYDAFNFGLGFSYLSAEQQDVPGQDDGQFVGAITLSTHF